MKLVLVLFFLCLSFSNFAKAEVPSASESNSLAICLRFYSDFSQTRKLVKKNNLHGFELISADPFGLSQKNDFPVFVVKKLPKSHIPGSRVKWLQDERSYNRVKQLISDSVPIVVGELNPSVLAEAFVIGADSFQLARDFFLAEPSKYSHLIFIKPTTSISVIEHEVQHWQDRENGTLNLIKERLIAWNKKAKVSPDILRKIFITIDEARGYGRQEIALLAEKNLIHTEVLAAEFRDFYVNQLDLILGDMKKNNTQQLNELLTILKNFELPGTNKINFSNIFRI